MPPLPVKRIKRGGCPGPILIWHASTRISIWSLPRRPIRPSRAATKGMIVCYPQSPNNNAWRIWTSNGLRLLFTSSQKWTIKTACFPLLSKCFFTLSDTSRPKASAATDSSNSPKPLFHPPTPSSFGEICCCKIHTKHFRHSEQFVSLDSVNQHHFSDFYG